MSVGRRSRPPASEGSSSLSPTRPATKSRTRAPSASRERSPNCNVSTTSPSLKSRYHPLCQRKNSLPNVLTTATIPSGSKPNGQKSGRPIRRSTPPSPTRPRRSTTCWKCCPIPRGAAHGTRAQLRHRRRPGALHVDERLQRASSHGLGFVRPARRERRHLQQHAAARVDAAQHRRHEGADEAPRLRLRLVARSHHLPARLLQVEPVVLHQAV